MSDISACQGTNIRFHNLQTENIKNHDSNKKWTGPITVTIELVHAGFFVSRFFGSRLFRTLNNVICCLRWQRLSVPSQGNCRRSDNTSVQVYSPTDGRNKPIMIGLLAKTCKDPMVCSNKNILIVHDGIKIGYKHAA